MNKTTAKVRAVIAAFAEANAEKMHQKLNEIEDPKDWMDCYLRAIEYHIPKLGRTEVVGDGGGPVAVQRIERVVVDPLALPAPVKP